MQAAVKVFLSAIDDIDTRWKKLLLEAPDRWFPIRLSHYPITPFHSHHFRDHSLDDMERQFPYYHGPNCGDSGCIQRTWTRSCLWTAEALI